MATGNSIQPCPVPTPRLNPHRARGTDGAPLPRNFVPWRFSDAGLRACGRPRHCRRPKTCTGAEITSGARPLIGIAHPAVRANPQIHPLALANRRDELAGYSFVNYIFLVFNYTYVEPGYFCELLTIFNF